MLLVIRSASLSICQCPSGCADGCCGGCGGDCCDVKGGGGGK
jgi:hypothetical protein